MPKTVTLGDLQRGMKAVTTTAEKIVKNELGLSWDTILDRAYDGDIPPMVLSALKQERGTFIMGLEHGLITAALALSDSPILEED